jgi:hypothetical protein
VPWELLQGTGVFNSMVQRTGDNAKKVREKALSKYNSMHPT